jgi:hypothetical protein
MTILPGWITDYIMSSTKFRPSDTTYYVFSILPIVLNLIISGELLISTASIQDYSFYQVSSYFDFG